MALLGMLPALASAACDWSRPGAAPYRGPVQATVQAAIDAYTDIPPAARAELVAKIRAGLDDGLVTITRDGMTSPQGEVTALRDMHWAHGLCRGAVSRAAWRPDHAERALLYSAWGAFHVVVPVVCFNVARVDFVRREAPAPQLSVPAAAPHRVAEPGTLELALAALCALAGLNRVSSRVPIQARALSPARGARRGLFPSAGGAR